MSSWYKTLQWLKEEYDEWEQRWKDFQKEQQEAIKRNHGIMPWYDRKFQDYYFYLRKRGLSGVGGYSPYGPFYTGNSGVPPALEPAPPSAVGPALNPPHEPGRPDMDVDDHPPPPHRYDGCKKKRRLYWGRRYYKKSKMRKRGVYYFGSKGVTVRKAARRKAKSFFIK